MAKETQHVPVYVSRLKELMVEAGWRRAEELAAASGLSFAGCKQMLFGRYATMQYPTAVVLALAFSKKIGREVDPNWIRGLE